jgi:hypothetical protein
LLGILQILSSRATQSWLIPLTENGSASSSRSFVMPVRVRCSGCDSLYKLPDHLAGKTVRCKGCGSTFKVPAPEVEVDEVAEILAGVESAADEPALRHAADEEVFEDSRAQEPLDADEGDVKPSKGKGKGKKAAGGKRMSMAVLAILAVVLLVILGGAAGAYFFLFGDSSKPAVKAKPAPQPINPGKAKDATPPEDAKAEEGKEETDPAKENAIPLEGPISYVKHVQPFLSTYCGKCHGEAKPKAGLTVTSIQGIMRGGKNKKPVVVPMEPDQSPLVLAVEHKGKLKMPPQKEKQPKPAEKAMLRIWVTEGAQDDTGKAGVLLPSVGPQLPLDNEGFRRLAALVSNPLREAGAFLQFVPHPANTQKAR